MISMLNKAEMQAWADAMTDDPNDVVLADIWDCQNACQFAGKPTMSPKQWIEFGRWYCQDSSGLSADIATYIDSFRPTEE